MRDHSEAVLLLASTEGPLIAFHDRRYLIPHRAGHVDGTLFMDMARQAVTARLSEARRLSGC